LKGLRRRQPLGAEAGRPAKPETAPLDAELGRVRRGVLVAAPGKHKVGRVGFVAEDNFLRVWSTR
jgi:hypothetical protein